MKQYKFWAQVSNYSVITCAIAMISGKFFKKYLGNIMVPLLFIAGTAIILFLIAELMKFTLKRRQ